MMEWKRNLGGWGGPAGPAAAGGRGRPEAAKPRRSRGALRAVSLRAAQTGRKAEKATL